MCLLISRANTGILRAPEHDDAQCVPVPLGGFARPCVVRNSTGRNDDRSVYLARLQKRIDSSQRDGCLACAHVCPKSDEGAIDEFLRNAALLVC